MMNQDVKPQWGAALTSGEYTQCRCGHLEGEDGWCCLGVLCAIAVKAGIARRVTRSSPSGLLVVYEDIELPELPWYSSSVYVPKPVQEWAGLPTLNPLIDLNGTMFNLTGLNDSHLSFEEIWLLIDAQF